MRNLPDSRYDRLDLRIVMRILTCEHVDAAPVHGENRGRPVVIAGAHEEATIAAKS